MINKIKSFFGKTKQATVEELKARLVELAEQREKIIQEQIEITKELESR